MKIRVAILLLLLFIVAGGFSQGKRFVSANGDVGGSIPGKPGYGMYRGNVRIVVIGKDISIRCDYAEVNINTSDFVGHGNLKITMKNKSTITGKEIRNLPQQDEMLIDRDVVYTSKDGKTQLFTDRMYYNNKTDVAYFLNSGNMVQDSTTLVSKKGYFISNKDISAFRGNVVVNSPKYHIESDTLEMRGDSVFFYEPTSITADSNYIYCEHGWYDSKSEKANLTCNAYIIAKEQQMWGDSIFYELKAENGEAFGNVKVIDTVQKIIIHSQYALNRKQQGDALFTDDILAILIDEDEHGKSDSLFLNSDTLRMKYDSLENVESICAYYKVRFFREDMQGVCDSLVYLMTDSTMRMYYDPILWSNQDQLTGDSVIMYLSNNKPDSMLLGDRAFIVSQSYDTLNFNQIKGKSLKGYFNVDSKLERVEIFIGVETIYYVTDDADSSLVGILKVKSQDMTIRLLNQKIHRITYRQPEAGTMYPEKDLPPSERVLQGYFWHNVLRPKSRDEFRVQHL